MEGLRDIDDDDLLWIQEIERRQREERQDREDVAWLNEFEASQAKQRAWNALQDTRENRITTMWKARDFNPPVERWPAHYRTMILLEKKGSKRKYSRDVQNVEFYLTKWLLDNGMDPQTTMEIMTMQDAIGRQIVRDTWYDTPQGRAMITEYQRVITKWQNQQLHAPKPHLVIGSQEEYEWIQNQKKQ